MEILKKRNYRVQTISKLIISDKEGAKIQQLPISEGLNIEKQCPCSLSGSPSYYVIATIKVNKDNYPEIEVCGDRILDVEPSEWELFRQLCKTAGEIVKTQNMELD